MRTRDAASLGPGNDLDGSSGHPTVHRMHNPGAYDAERASALSGVPRSTIHYWARNEVLVPSVSATRVKLWSYADLMALRVIYWLRQKKTDQTGPSIAPTGMRTIRRALKQVRALGEPLWHPEQTSIWIDTSGEIHVRAPAGASTLDGQMLLADSLNLIAPFTTREGLRGPDLARPRAELRIVPGKLSGSPHIVGTRLETRALHALVVDGLDVETVATFYPFASRAQIAEALDLERQLAANLAIRVAA